MKRTRDEWKQLAEKCEREYNQFITSFPMNAIALKLENDNKTQFAIVHPSTRYQGKLQVSYFDSKGAYGDSIENTMKEIADKCFNNYFRNIVEVIY